MPEPIASPRRASARTAARKTRFRRLDDDPLAMLVNFFDCAIVFATALLLVVHGTMTENPPVTGDPPDEPPESQRVSLQHFRPAEGKAKGEGVRLGVAYRLASGQVIYIPDKGERR
jgi:hypothetical protein